jgi:hypothetical protein
MPESRRPAVDSGAAYGDAPIAQLAEAADLKSVQCRFESDWGHSVIAGKRGACASRHPLEPVSVSRVVTTRPKLCPASLSASSWLCAYTDIVNAALA